jgi:hypothetical protein
MEFLGEKLKERLNVAQKALFRLREATLMKELTFMERDALIHRFKIAFEIMWKTAKSIFASHRRNRCSIA